MEHRSWQYRATAVVLVAVAGLAVALAEETRREQRVEVVIGGEHESLGLEDLADGETRSFGSNDREITVTRRGDRLEVAMDGKPIVVPAPDAHLVLGDTMTWIGAGGDGEEPRSGFRYLFVSADGDEEGEESRVVVRVDERVVTSEDGERRVRVVGPAHGLAGAWVDDGSVVFRCPDDGTTLRAPADRVTEKGFTCPVCGRTMERSENAEVKVIEVEKVERNGEHD